MVEIKTEYEDTLDIETYHEGGKRYLRLEAKEKDSYYDTSTVLILKSGQIRQLMDLCIQHLRGKDVD